MEIALATYILTVLIPINGLLYLASRKERNKNRRILFQLWKRGWRQ